MVSKTRLIFGHIYWKTNNCLVNDLKNISRYINPAPLPLECQKNLRERLVFGLVSDSKELRRETEKFNSSTNNGRRIIAKKILQLSGYRP